MSDSYQREITDFLSDYGATGIAIVPGGKHPKVEFDFRGKHVAYTIAASPSDHRASANMISELKRTLGEPVEEPAKETRRLADMLPSAADRPTFKGKLALYQNGTKKKALMFRFFLPKELTSAAGISLGQQFNISALDKYTWHLHLKANESGGHHPTLQKEKSEQKDPDFYVIRGSAVGLTKLDPFGVSPADYSILGDALIVYLPPETIGHIGRRGRRPESWRRPAPSAPPTPSAPPVSAERAGQDHPAPAPPGGAPADTDDTPVAERLRVLLAMIRSAERQTGYRLLKVRRDDKTDGVWTWRAPEIRLDE